MLKCLRSFILLMFLFLSFLASGQSVIGMTKEETREVIKKDHREFRRDNSVTKQAFNYLKFVNSDKTRTWILYFTDEDICKTSKLICDYSEFDKVVGKLSSNYKKVADSQWEYMNKSDTIQLILTKQEWYFSVRETRKK